MRRRNRPWFAVAGVLALFSSFSSAGMIYYFTNQDCKGRNAAREDVRTMTAGAVDEVAIVYNTSEQERAILRERVERRALKDLPPRNC